MSELLQIVVGLAGHIDHGKSSLISRLTGTATDRRPEEQRRGMTVDLGFSHFVDGDVRVALIDVPGHERFVHNMLSGAAAVQFGLLVVAADDSVMPQTREHMDIIKLLSVQGGVIAMTKIDLVDDEQLEIVQLEIDELVTGTPLEGAPVIPVSNHTGAGISELRESLVQLAEHPRSDGDDDERPFRMSIDRAFTLDGHGTIVTGTVRHGRVRTGEQLILLPEQQRVKVRQLQAHGNVVEAVRVGHRAAINVSGIKITAVRRGDELVGHACYQPTRRLLASLSVLRDCRHGIRHREAVRLHVGTREVTARILLADKELAPGSRATALLVCQSPVVGEYGQPVIVRRLSPAATLGGGRILAPLLMRRQSLRRFLDLGERLNSPELQQRLPTHLDLQGPLPLDASRWQVAVGGTMDETEKALAGCVDDGSIRVGPTSPPKYVSAEEWGRLSESLTRRCAAELLNRKPQRLVPQSVVTHGLDRSVGADVVASVLEDLIRTRKLVARGDRIGLFEGAALTSSEQALMEALNADITTAGTVPPTLKELATHHDVAAKKVEQMIQFLVDEGRLLRVSPELAITPAALDSLRKRLVEFFADRQSGTAADIRDAWGVTRKYAIPYLEYFDRLQITSRTDSVRVAGARLHDFSIEEMLS
jgi:selenocysteine-specific elongation factor